MFSIANGNYCFWDKHEFIGTGIKCPIFYKPKQIVRRKKEYYINRNVARIDEINKIGIDQIIKEEIYYDDIFCSVQCCLAWIDDHHYDPKYQNSRYILQNEISDSEAHGVRACDLNNARSVGIQKANHWRTLIAFGGFLTITEFRKHNKIYEIEDVQYLNNTLKQIYKEVNFVQ